MATNSLRLRRTLTTLSSLTNHYRSLPTVSSSILSSPSSLLTQPVISSCSSLFGSFPLQSRSFKSSPPSLYAYRGSYKDEQDEKLDPDTILFEGCDYNHWLITMDFPKGLDRPTPEQMVNTYVETCAKGLNISIEEAKKRIYACSTTTYEGFQALMTEAESEKFNGLPGVQFILPDSYIDPANKEYGGDKYENGVITPRPPPFRYGQIRERNTTRPPRFDRSQGQQGGAQPQPPPYNQPRQPYPPPQNGPPSNQFNFNNQSERMPPPNQFNYNQAGQNYGPPPPPPPPPPHGPPPPSQPPHGYGGRDFGQGGVRESYGQGGVDSGRDFGQGGVRGSYGQGGVDGGRDFGQGGVRGSYGQGGVDGGRDFGQGGVRGSYGQGGVDGGRDFGQGGVRGSYGQGGVEGSYQQQHQQGAYNNQVPNSQGEGQRAPQAEQRNYTPSGQALPPRQERY